MKAIPPFELIPQPANDDARVLVGFKWAAKVVGHRHQLGGQPVFIQEATWPACRNGHGRMTFYGQLDSINDDICIADCGMIYVFVCFDCFETTSFVQSS
jgi:hypothetical protein